MYCTYLYFTVRCVTILRRPHLLRPVRRLPALHPRLLALEQPPRRRCFLVRFPVFLDLSARVPPGWMDLFCGQVDWRPMICWVPLAPSLASRARAFPVACDPRARFASFLPLLVLRLCLTSRLCLCQSNRDDMEAFPVRKRGVVTFKPTKQSTYRGHC